MEYTSSSQKHTIEIGKKLVPQLKGGDIILLYGELGSGKTTFVKGLALGLGIKDDITSPTFTLMNVYKIQNLPAWHVQNFVHVDTYRIKNEDELVEIGIEDYLGDIETICVVEWPEKILGLLKKLSATNIFITDEGDCVRKIKIRK